MYVGRTIKLHQINGFVNHCHLEFQWVQADAEAVPFEDESMDLYTIAFGIRNTTHIDKVSRVFLYIMFHSFILKKSTLKKTPVNSKNMASVHAVLETYLNSVEYLRWSFLKRLKSVKDFCGKLHFRCSEYASEANLRIRFRKIKIWKAYYDVMLQAKRVNNSLFIVNQYLSLWINHFHLTVCFFWQVLSEAYRVLKPGGRFSCLEFSYVDNTIIRR